MNKAIRSFLFTSIVFSALFLVSAVSVSAQMVLGEILNRMDAHNKSLNSLESKIKMVKVDAALGEANADVQEGTVNYIPEKKKAGTKMYARVDWVKPNETMLLVGDEYKIYRPELKQGYQGTRSQAAKNNSTVAGPLSFLSMSRDELKKNYKVVFIDMETVSNGTKTAHLQLTPLTGNSYKQADLWVDGDGMPVQAKVTSKNNDTTTILLTGADKNKSPNYEKFKLKFPEGTKIIKG